MHSLDEADADPGFGVYIHWPFCAAKCPYCDFNSHVRATIDHAAWRHALIADIEAQAELHDTALVTSVFFGGGTPSLMEPETVGAILDTLHRKFRVSNDLEVTLEANPTSVEAQKFREFKEGGVNRVSMGIQALNDVDLRHLGRMHTAEEAMRAFSIARSTFDRVSFDLIYARQHQTLESWEQELNQALSLAVDHLSLYQLTIEQGTRFGELAALNRLRGLPGADLSADMYELTNQVCRNAGLEAYEVSNHAREGAVCRHNLTYWRYGPYLGVGPGAHGRVSRDGIWYATEAERRPESWLADPAGRTAATPLESHDRAQEYILMALRLTEGLDLSRLALMHDTSGADDAIGDLLALGLLVRNGDRIATTDRGRLVLNSVTERICSAL